ncbi:hypothetical protein [Streptomyces sp. NPDC057325]|uniref:hypothetical protein n=1 Tax=unclassified Streptomyces TaxID=2593676 RepID=UPI003637038E
MGELFPLSSLRAKSNGLPVGFGSTVPGPFLPVCEVEHCPVPVDDEGNTLPWWKRSLEPSANVVPYATRSDDPVQFRTTLERFAAPDSGWHGIFGAGTELDCLWWSCVEPAALPPDSQQLLRPGCEELLAALIGNDAVFGHYGW